MEDRSYRLIVGNFLIRFHPEVPWNVVVKRIYAAMLLFGGWASLVRLIILLLRDAPIKSAALPFVLSLGATLAMFLVLVVRGFSLSRR